ncbi:MAG: NAD(P)-binding domain-containing protein [Bauldia sp.]
MSPAGPSPPGDYPIVIVGSGPGALQLAYSLSRYGIRHAVISEDSGPGGMFRKWPLFQRLLSSTKPYAPGGRGSRNFERLDWNSLLADEPGARSLQANHMDGSSNYPSRAEMEANLAEFAERTGLVIRYGCRWEATRLEESAAGRRFVLVTSDGEYRCTYPVFAVGVAEPWVPPIPGIELAHHYAQVRAPETYAGKRVFIIGKHNSGFEIATGLLSWAASLTLCSPSPAKLSVAVKSLVGVRARYALPFEDHALGGGVNILDGSIERIVRADGALRVDIRTTVGGTRMSLGADEVINVTGFVSPLRDLPRLGVATFGQSALPAQTAWWESATVPGIHFAGTITQGVAGLSKHGIPPNSGAVQGYRYNARLLARRLAETRFGKAGDRPSLRAGDVGGLLIGEVADGPALWHQKGFLAHAVSVSAENGIRDEGIVPLTAFLDEGRNDGAAVTVEADGTGAIYPVAYVRRGGTVKETVLPGDALLDFNTAENRSALASALAPLGVS